jgi:spore germination protein GerM
VVHFGCTAQSGGILNAVPATRVQVPSGADAKETAIRALLRGPTAEQVRAGYLSNFGATSANVGFTVRVASGLATVDFDPAIRNVKYIFLGQMDVAQIIATLAQFSDVRRVAILIDGEEWCRALEAGC